MLQSLRVALRREEEPETSGLDNLGSLAAALGLVESIESGAPVQITPRPPRDRRG